MSGRDFNRAVSIDYSTIVEAQAYYADHGFADTPVPWVVSEQAYERTRPEEATPYATLGGFLVASAEQSFFHLMLQGQRLGKAQATSPCFRDEAHDEIHSPYFLKTELIETEDVSDTALLAMVAVARDFFSRYLSVRIEPMGDGSLDIVCARTGLELGSYGVRYVDEYAWVYGTGVALPRLSYALDQLNT